MDDTLKSMNLEFCGSGKHKITIEKLLDSQDAILLDVRSREEVEALRFDLFNLGITTVNIPIDELPERLSELPKDKIIACFCSSGTRAAWAYLYLKDKGYNARWLAATNEDLASVLKAGRIYKAQQGSNKS